MLSAFGQILGGLGGLFGSKGHDAGGNAYLSIAGQANAARNEGKKFGFNPLTLLRYGQVGAAPGASGPPLASIELLTDGLKGLDDEISGDKERRRKAQDLQNDLAQLKLDQLRSGVVAVGPSATDGVGAGPSLFRRPASDVNSPLTVTNGPARVPSDPSPTLRFGTPYVSPSGVPFGPFSGITGPDSVNWPDKEIRSASDDESRVPEKPVYIMGMELPPTSGSSDAEAIGSRYGEDFMSPSWFTGWGSFAHDAMNAAAWEFAGWRNNRRLKHKTDGGTKPPRRRPVSP